jgi:hypothetical protein
VISRTTRHRLLEQMLRRALRAGTDAPPTGACLDAEKLAVWVDGGLDAGAAREVERHVSSCGRCQALVGVMARTVPLEPARAAWWRHWPAWTIPLAAGAAAAVVWMLVPERRAAPPAAKVAASADSAQARVERPQAAGPPPARTEPMPSEELRPAPARGGDRVAALAPPAESKALAAGNERRPPDRRADVEGPAAGRAPAAAAPRVEPAAPAPQAQAPGRLAAAEAPPIEIASPDAAFRWRLTGGAGVERTTDGGASWQALATGESARLVAGSAPSPDVCWLVGAGGTVLVTTDGRTWRRVPFPAQVDLVGVQSSDARRASVTTADGRVWRTNDAGATWTPQ